MRWKRLICFKCKRMTHFNMQVHTWWALWPFHSLYSIIWLVLVWVFFYLICIWRDYIGFQHVALGDKTHQWASSWEINVSQCPSFVQTCYILIGRKVTVSTLQHAGLQEYKIFYFWKKHQATVPFINIHMSSSVVWMEKHVGRKDKILYMFQSVCWGLGT